ncbi:MvdC family ATP-grasp ribosomal peptide maturase [Rudanella paleaurantiibacter]|uniref:MvdC family ATP-grasp ribosomal peptide maturase n=1 Tax=Rudanella paleaurantiibacter TaxID=2614655 RepID=A0A7J5TT85_9BACT|nr:MvdC family ATP-grasp ribosomal peptide maturase [Rudanella paleaurantiibacter]KAB7727017.1 MvdC family ATP-grasp ribosomal peptide maturase [Rudanella paleaurantiibacter]
MILCLTHSRDEYTIDLVQQTLRVRGFQSVRLNTDQIAHSQISVDLTTRSARCEGPGLAFDTRDITAVWYRKLWAITPPTDLPEAYRRATLQAFSRVQMALFGCLPGRLWMNDFTADTTVQNNKMGQLEAAQEAGLAIPKTLFSNDPTQIRAFFERCRGEVVAKLYDTLTYGMSGSGPVFPTTPLSANDLTDDTALMACPMIFQERVQAQTELRVAYVDGQCFTGSIDTRGSLSSPTDWRYAADVSTGWKSYTLPDTVRAQLTALMRRLGLLFGAIDLMVQPDGTPVFLEVNPQGEWGMLQRDLHLPIAQAIAHRLSYQ